LHPLHDPGGAAPPAAPLLVALVLADAEPLAVAPPPPSDPSLVVVTVGEHAGTANKNNNRQWDCNIDVSKLIGCISQFARSCGRKNKAISIV
jgi:hypothetical protein